MQKVAGRKHQCIIDGDSDSDFETHLEQILRRRIGRHREKAVEFDPVIPHNLERHMVMSLVTDAG